MTASIELFEIFKTKFSEQEAKFIVKEIEKIETVVTAKIEQELDRKQNVLAPKEDITLLKAEIAKSKVDTIKWVFAFFVTLMLAIVGLYIK